MTNKIVLAFALALSLCFVACDKKEKELSDSEILVDGDIEVVEILKSKNYAQTKV